MARTRDSDSLYARSIRALPTKCTVCGSENQLTLDYYLTPIRHRPHNLKDMQVDSLCGICYIWAWLTLE